MYICGSNIVLSLSVKIFCCLRRVALNELVLLVFVNVCMCVHVWAIFIANCYNLITCTLWNVCMFFK